jgi:succinate dehydrogenase / fumarate reductase membrane anchor subunit
LLVRLTSLALAPLAVGFVWLMIDLLRKDYNGVRAELTHPIPAILLLAFIFAGIVHMELGMRSIIIDYIGGQSRAWTLAANTCFAALLALACLYATLRVAFT